MTALSIRRATKRYGAFTAISNLDLDVAKGEFVVLLGPSGCGKTTTLRCAAGLEQLSDGEIWLGDRLVTSRNGSVPPEQRDIGMVFQSYAVWPHLTVMENIAFGLRLKKLGKAEIEARVRRTVDMVGLAGLEERNPGQLSGGQQQRIALARAIVLEPSILLFDEPLSNLDAKLREHMRFEIRQLQQRLGITSLYVTHDQQEAMVVADRIVLLNAGRIDQQGPPRDLYRTPSTRFGAEFVGLANIFAGSATPGGGGSLVRIDSDLALESVQSAAAGSIDVMVRPEDVKLSTEKPEGPNAFRAMVSQNVFLGNMSDLTVTVGAHDFRLQPSPPTDVEVGQAVWIQIPPHRVVLLAR